MAESIERCDNWLRVVFGLLYVKKGLQVYVDTKSKQQYQTFMNNVNVKCKNQTCDQCQINSKCPNCRGNLNFKHVLNHFCHEMKEEIHKTNLRNNPSWMNTDSTKWRDQKSGYWQVAKCYLNTPGYLDNTGPNDMDASGLISICMNSSFIKQQITNIQSFGEVRDIRNKTLHDAHYELDGQTADDCLDKMIIILEDPQELLNDTFAKQAADHIRKIKDKTEKIPGIMNEALHNWLQTNFDVKKSLNEIEGSIYDRLQKKLEELIEEKVERKVKQEMRNFSYDRSNDGKEQQDLQKQLANYYQRQLNSASISPLISDKAERLDMFYVPPKIVEKDHRKVGATQEENGTHVTSYRQMFCKTGKLRKNVFIVGEAGMGKSACAAMCALKWANQISSTNSINEPDTNDSHQTSFDSLRAELQVHYNDIKHIFLPENEHNHHFQDDNFFSEIEFLFHLTLRNSCDLCNLTDMIRDQLINRIYQQDKRDVANMLMHSVLSNRKCVIILDGLDEWTHPKETNCSCSGDKVMPYLETTIDATMLITTRPWRMSQQRVKDTNIDTYLEIEGTSHIGLLLQKILNSLNKRGPEKKTLLDFIRYVERMKLTRLLSVLIISKLLLSLWFEGKHESRSRCDIYAYAIEMLFGRTALPVSIVSQKTNRFPRCFQQTELVQMYYSIVRKLAELAFTSLFSNDQISFLVIKKVDILAQDDLVCVLKSGILQETQSASLIRRESSYSFIHKTVQEFLAAIHMFHHREDFDRVLTLFNEKNGEMSDISQVFIFMCGLNIELANSMSAMISNSISPDNQSFLTDTRVILIQSTIVSGYKEAAASQVLDIKLSLSSFDFSYTTDTEILDDLLSINKSNVRYIKTSTDQSQEKLQEVFCSCSDTLTNVKIFSLAGKFDLLACNSLKCLSIYGTKTNNIKVNTNSLIALDLNCASKAVEYSTLHSFDRELNELEHLKLKSIENISLLCQTLPRLIKLKYITIDNVVLGDHALLLPYTIQRVELSRVKISARSLKQMIERLEDGMHMNKDDVNCTLLKCSVEPKAEYEEILSDVRRRGHYYSDIGHKHLCVTCKNAIELSNRPLIRFSIHD